MNLIDYSNRVFRFHLNGVFRNEKFEISGEKQFSNGEFEIAQPNLKIYRTLKVVEDHIEEQYAIENLEGEAVFFTNIEMGTYFDIQDARNGELFAIPFTVQQDGWKHSYTGAILCDGTYEHIVNAELPNCSNVYGNSVYSDYSRVEPDLVDRGFLRSEAWCWYHRDEGVLAIKYSFDSVEYSIVKPYGEEQGLLFGGTGLCLYGEPDAATRIEAKDQYTFAKTYFYEIGEEKQEAYRIFRDFMDRQGHCYPKDYNPPIHWNELYDIGWHHSVKKDLIQFYSKEALRKEAEKAVKCGCELLYLDPGWEYAEGLTLWDDQRLGFLEDFISEIKRDFGLDVGLRMILRTYINYWPNSFLVKADKDLVPTANMMPQNIMVTYQLQWDVCPNNPEYKKIKEKRMDKIASSGLKFIMLDEMDWRGPCWDENHGHRIPSRAQDHYDAILDLSKKIHDKYPEILIEHHDSVWPWKAARYLPTYYKQGFGKKGFFQENWGFEFMWNCINDLKTGRALCLYYYNLASNIPLYLHINMSADNDECLFFWWAASTVRHLGIGGKESHPSVEFQNEFLGFDREKRFQAYCDQMKIYKKYKPFFTRGRFVGVAENIHLHILDEQPGGVINLFNISDTEQELSFEIDADILKMNQVTAVSGEVEYVQKGEKVCIKAVVKPMAHKMIIFK